MENSFDFIFPSEREAWRDFYDHVRPGIWANLCVKDRRELNTAERDFYEKRRDPKGRPIRLGSDRIERLLLRVAPDVYAVERTVVFRRL